MRKEQIKMIKAIHAQENKAAAKEKAKSVISRLREMKLNKAADKKIQDTREELAVLMKDMDDLNAKFSEINQYAQEAVQKINAMFNTNISVDFSKEWKGVLNNDDQRQIDETDNSKINSDTAVDNNSDDNNNEE